MKLARILFQVVALAGASGCSTISVAAHDDLATLPQQDTMVRWCFEERWTVLQTATPEPWTAAGRVHIFRHPNWLVPGPGVELTCRPEQVFDHQTDQILVRRTEDDYYLSFLSADATEFFIDEKLVIDVDAGGPRFMHATRPDGWRYYVFLEEAKNTAQERVRYYLLAAFAPSCTVDPARFLRPLGPLDPCGNGAPMPKQTDVGGGGEKK